MMLGDAFERQNSKGKRYFELSWIKLTRAAPGRCWWLA